MLKSEQEQYKRTQEAKAEALKRAFYYLKMSVVTSDDKELAKQAEALAKSLKKRADKHIQNVSDL